MLLLLLRDVVCEMAERDDIEPRDQEPVRRISRASLADGVCLGVSGQRPCSMQILYLYFFNLLRRTIQEISEQGALIVDEGIGSSCCS
jgi:hypothetical protein